MAVTAVPQGLTPRQWDAKYFREYLNKDWITMLSGTGSNAMIQMKDSLMSKPGDSVNFTLVNRLKNSATDQNGTLEGNEEALDLRSMPLTIREYAHAVRWKRYGEQLSAIPLRNAHKDALMDWNMELSRDNLIRELGSIDGVAYSAATDPQKDTWNANNADRVLYGNLAGNYNADHSLALATIDGVSDTLQYDSLARLKRIAKNADPKVRPIKARSAANNSDMYILLAPSLLIRDLSTDSEFVQANRDARQRGKSNPIFMGADYVLDNIAIYEIEDIPTISGVGAAGIDVAPAYLCGAQAIGIAWAMRPKTIGDDFDYHREYGVSISQYMEVGKLRFGSGVNDTDNPKDHGIVTAFFASEPDA